MGKRAKKDPLAPKPPLNSYMEFARDERPKVLHDLGQVSTTEVGKEIGLRWKNLKEDEREKYMVRFRANQEQYKIEKLNYEKKTSSMTPKDVPNDNTKKKKKKNPLAPKLPLSSYMEFAKDQRSKVLEDLGKLSLTEVGKELGRRWQSLSKADKQVFEVKSKENRTKYESEMKVFTNSTPLGNSDPPDQSDETASDVATTNGSSEADNQSCSQSDPIKLEHLGFAKQDGYSWHPALKTSTLARGTRVKVTFFGTGQVGTVDRSKWIVFSTQAESKIKTPKLSKTSTFRAGLEQMKSLRDKLLLDSPVTSSGIGFNPQMGGRRFRSLNKEHLQAEEEENTRLMEKKMSQDEVSKLWMCRDCAWKGKFRLKAKSHARDCGQRKRANQKKNKDKKYECSYGDCVLSFAMRSQLLKHYRYIYQDFL